jgi:DNA ligase-associated metallophosphoesterase
MIPPFECHPSGAAWWPQERLLAVADLHLEKGSSRAAQGVWLPPYDTVQTLIRLEDVVRALRPDRVLCLGDAFEDPGAWARMAPEDRSRLAALVRQAEWTWISGNHDPRRIEGLPGAFATEVEVGGVVFRHQPAAGNARRVFGHFHPKATVRLRGRRISGRCFLATETDLVLPAFGAYTGGLDRDDPALKSALRGPARAWLLHKDRVYSL